MPANKSLNQWKKAQLVVEVKRLQKLVEVNAELWKLTESICEDWDEITGMTGSIIDAKKFINGQLK